MVFCVASMASREASRLNFVRLPDPLFYVLLLWRLSVALAAPALDEDGCEQQSHSLIRLEVRPVRRAPIYIAAALPQNGPILRRPPRAEPHPSFERAGRFLPLIPI